MFSLGLHVKILLGLEWAKSYDSWQYDCDVAQSSLQVLWGNFRRDVGRSLHLWNGRDVKERNKTWLTILSCSFFWMRFNIVWEKKSEHENHTWQLHEASITYCGVCLRERIYESVYKYMDTSVFPTLTKPILPTASLWWLSTWQTRALQRCTAMRWMDSSCRAGSRIFSSSRLTRPYWNSSSSGMLKLHSVRQQFLWTWVGDWWGGGKGELSWGIWWKLLQP